MGIILIGRYNKSLHIKIRKKDSLTQQKNVASEDNHYHIYFERDSVSYGKT